MIDRNDDDRGGKVIHVLGNDPIFQQACSGLKFLILR